MTYERVYRQPYKFMGRGGDALFWERPIPNDSRVEQVSCNAGWFYAQMMKQGGDGT